MTARVIDGVALAATIRQDVAMRSAALKAQGTQPGLAVILVGSDPASQVYVRNKVTACQQAGLYSVMEQYPVTMSQQELLARIQALNVDPAIHGILVQLPLPPHMDAHQVIEAIEKPLIEHILHRTEGNKLRAAKILGIDRNTIRAKIKKLGIDVSKNRRD